MSPIPTPTQHSLAPADPSSPPPPKRGRPVAFDEPKRHEFCSLLRLGCTISRAAALVGISRRGVLYAAKREPDLAERIRLARQESEIAALRNVQAASSKSWRAAAWLLERDRRQPRRKPAATSNQRNELRRRDELRREVFQIVQDLLPLVPQPDWLDDPLAAYDSKPNTVPADITARRQHGDEVDASADLRRDFPHQFLSNGK